MKTLAVRFSDQVSEMETTHQRVKDIAEFLGVSQNKAVQYAINKAYDQLNDDRNIEAELHFKRHGRQVGGVTYLNHPEDFLGRVQKRIKDSIPLPHEDDESLERNLIFKLLTEEQQAQAKATQDVLEKRRLIAGFLQQQAGEAAPA